MTTDIKLLPLYAELQGHPKLEIVKHYARANVAHATAAKDAEIERLRADVEAWKASHAMLTDTCHHFQSRAERLAEALRWYVENDDTNEGQEGNEYWLAGRDRAIAVLRDHDQEGKDG